MKYCGKFSTKIDMSKFDEISIIYNSQDRQLLEFLQQHPAQRIVLLVSDYKKFAKEQEWEKLNAIKSIAPKQNFAICFNDICKFDMIDKTLQQCIDNLQMPYFMGFLVTNFDQLHYLCQHGVSDVYLAEDICFDLIRAKKIANQYNVAIRTFPNISQACVKSTPALKKFFIRPEDVVEYEDCIDVLEFWGPIDRQNTLHNIYSTGRWSGHLSDLIFEFDIPIDSKCIMPGFAQIRKNCSRKCMKGQSCKICDKIQSINNKLTKNNLIIKRKNND